MIIWPIFLDADLFTDLPHGILSKLDFLKFIRVGKYVCLLF